MTAISIADSTVPGPANVNTCMYREVHKQEHFQHVRGDITVLVYISIIYRLAGYGGVLTARTASLLQLLLSVKRNIVIMIQQQD
jgi:hypothetical protein